MNPILSHIKRGGGVTGFLDLTYECEGHSVVLSCHIYIQMYLTRRINES